MSYTHPQNQFVTRFIMPQNLDGVSILDCACGRGAWGFFIRSQIEGVPYIEGFDIFSPYIEKVRELNLYDKVYEMDIKDVGRFRKRYDIIMAMDVLEHLQKNDAIKVMRTLEKMCNRILIISLPIGSQKQGVGHDGNIYQIHKSSFTPDEMKRYGYKTKALNKFTKTLRVIERIRCLIFGLEYKEGRFVAWKEIDSSARELKSSSPVQSITPTSTISPRAHA